MRSHLAVVVLVGAVAVLSGCYIQGEGYYPPPVIHERVVAPPPVVIERPPVVIEQPVVVIDEPGVFFEPGIVFRVPIVVWDVEERREIVIERRDWDRWEIDREGHHIGPHRHHFEFRRDARHHPRVEEGHDKNVRMHVEKAKPKIVKEQK